MHSGNAIPAVEVSTPMQDVIYEISEKGMGVTAVVQDGSRVAGIITDGDLRRLLQKDENILKKKAGECMHLKPLTIHAQSLATAALQIMEERKVTSLLVTTEEGMLAGIIHIHDLWQTQMF